MAPSSLTTTKSVFRAPSTFWQGAFVQGQNRGAIQLQSPMVYTTLSLDTDSDSRLVDSAKRTGAAKSSVRTQSPTKSDIRWIPKQVLEANVPSVQSKQTTPNPATLEKKRPLSQQRQAVPSVSWRRKPTFPDPFLAQQQSITSQQSTEQKYALLVCRPVYQVFVVPAESVNFGTNLLLRGTPSFRSGVGSVKGREKADRYIADWFIQRDFTSAKIKSDGSSKSGGTNFVCCDRIGRHLRNSRVSGPIVKRKISPIICPVHRASD